MSKMSLGDKLSILVEVSKNSKLIILVLALLLFLIIFQKVNKRNTKSSKYTCAIISVLIPILLLFRYHESLSKMFDYMMNNIFIVMYFPNLAIYTFALIIVTIIFLISIFNYKTSKIIKYINSAVYIIINYLLALILQTISINNIDIFNQTAVYGNKQVTALIELSSLIFIIWIIFLILYKIILIYLKKEYKPPVKKLVKIKKVKKLPDNFEPKTVPEYIHGKVPKKPVTPNKKTDTILKAYDEMLTIDDYKVILKILKEQKEKEYKDFLRKEELLKEQTKFTELEDMYRSIR